MPSFKAKYSYTIKRGANPGGGGRNMTTDKNYSLNVSMQQVLSSHNSAALQWFTGMRNERHVVLGVPVVSLLLALRPRGGGAAHVGHAAAPQARTPHHPGAGQCGFPGLAPRRCHHQCSGGGCLPRGGERHGTAGGAGARRGPDRPLHCHIILTDPGHAVRKTHDQVKGRRRGERSEHTEPGRDFRPAFVEGDEAEILWTFGAGWRAGRPPVSLHCDCYNHSAAQRELSAGRSFLCQRAAPGRGSASASGPESHVFEFPELYHFFVPKAFSVSPEALVDTDL